MLYKIGNKQELATLDLSLPEIVYQSLTQVVASLDQDYGVGRDWSQVGGYVILAETREDLQQVRELVNFDTHPCEWVTRLGEDGSYLSALYLLNDDFTIMLYLPTAIAPDTILNDLEED